MILIAVQFFAITSVASAASYRVDVSGQTVTDGWDMSGYFTFDDPDANGFGGEIPTEMSIQFVQAGSGLSTIVFDLGNAGFKRLDHGSYYRFQLGGKAGGIGPVMAANDADFYFSLLTGSPGFGYFRPSANSGLLTFGALSVDVQELNLSTVPLPAAAWMFIAGLAALFGGKWRLLRRTPVTA